MSEAVCHILSTEEDNLWTYTTPDGKNMKKGIEFILPYVKDKTLWQLPPDVMYWEEWPVAQPFLFMGAIGLNNKEYWIDNELMGYKVVGFIKNLFFH